MDELDDDLDRRLTQLAEQLLLPPRPPVPDEAAAQRSHRHSWMLVAAIGTLVIGLGATLVALRHDAPRDDVLMPPVATTELAPPPTSEVHAAGGIFDPSGVGLRRKLINAMESDADRVYLGFQSADGNEPWGGVVVADAETGAILADHPVPGGVINDSMVAARGRIWFTTIQENDMEATALWSITGLDPPARVDRLDRGMTLGGDDSGLWLQAQGELQLRDPADGALVAKEFWTGFGWVASGEGGIWSSNADNGMIVELDGAQGDAPVALEAGVISYIRVAGGQVFIAQGSRILRFDVAANTQLIPVETPSKISSIDANGGVLWVALNGSPNDEVAIVLMIDVATGNTASFDVPLTATQPKIAGRPGGAIICAHADGTESSGRPDHVGCRVITAGRRADDPAPAANSTTTPESPASTSPRLSIEPAGPYADGQDVIVHGSGFDPGKLEGGIGECPAGDDTARYERCGRWDVDNPVTVGPDGTFSAPFRLFAATPFGVDCRAAPGCVLAWVPPRKSMVAALPLEFTP